MGFFDDLQAMFERAKAAQNTGPSKTTAPVPRQRPTYAGPNGIRYSTGLEDMATRAKVAQYRNEANIAAEEGEARERAAYEKANKPYPGYNKGTDTFGMQFDAPITTTATNQPPAVSPLDTARAAAYEKYAANNQPPSVSPLDTARAAAYERAANDQNIFNYGRGAKNLREFTDSIAQGNLFPNAGSSNPWASADPDGVAERQAIADTLSNEWWENAGLTGPGGDIRNEFIKQNTPDVFDVNAPKPFHLTASGDLAVGPSPAAAGGSATVAGLPGPSIRAIEAAQERAAAEAAASAPVSYIASDAPGGAGAQRFTESGVPVEFVDFTQRAGEGGRAATLFNKREHNSVQERLGDRPTPDLNDVISDTLASLSGGAKKTPTSAGGETTKTKKDEGPKKDDGPKKPFLERDLPDFNQMKQDFLYEQGSNLAGRYVDAFNYAKDGLLDEDLSHGERLGRILSGASLAPAIGLNEQSAAINSMILPDTDAWGNIFRGEATWGDAGSAGLDVLSVVPGLGLLKLAKTGKVIGKAGTGTRIAPKAPRGKPVAERPPVDRSVPGFRAKNRPNPKADKAPNEPKLTKADKAKADKPTKADKPPKESKGILKKGTKFTAGAAAVGAGVYGAGLLANKLGKDGPPTSTGAGETIFDDNGREYWHNGTGWMVSDGSGGWTGVNAEQQAALDEFGASSGGTYVRHAGG